MSVYHFQIAFRRYQVIARKGSHSSIDAGYFILRIHPYSCLEYIDKLLRALRISISHQEHLIQTQILRTCLNNLFRFVYIKILNLIIHFTNSHTKTWENIFQHISIRYTTTKLHQLSFSSFFQRNIFDNIQYFIFILHFKRIQCFHQSIPVFTAEDDIILIS